MATTDVGIYPEIIFDVDDGSPLGYYAKGHHDPAEFLAACEREQEHDPEHAGIGYVKHVWWRNVPFRDPDGVCGWRFVRAEPGSRGAYRATVLDTEQARVDRALPGIVERNEKALAMHRGVCAWCQDGEPCRYGGSLELIVAQQRRDLERARDRMAAHTPPEEAR